MEADIRWRQRLANYRRACANLQSAVDLARQRPLSDTGLTGSKDATREAFAKGLVAEGQTWMDMIKGRNLSVHTYNAETADQLARSIIETYSAELLRFLESMTARERP